jgi:hypothetical protein
MPSIELKTDLLAPKYFKTYEFSGFHPTRFLKVAPQLIKDIFQITEPNTFEDKLQWDKSSDPIEFFAQWRGKDSKDSRTDFWVVILAQGVQSEKDKMGNINIKVTSTLDTKFSYSNFLERALIAAYSYLYYYKIRRRYIQEQKKLLDVLDSEIKKVLGEIEG